jgi:hypothetical protein
VTLPEGTSSLTIEGEPENAQPDRPGAGELQVTVIAPDDEVRLHEAVPVHGQTLAREADPPRSRARRPCARCPTAPPCTSPGR